MIITDEDLEKGLRYAERAKEWQCGQSNCDCADSFPDFTKEDLVKDLIVARAQIRVLESNQCAC